MTLLTQPEPEHSSPLLKVLIVDDEALARARLRTLLGDCPALAVVAGEAADAQQALTALRHAAFDVVLLDIHMPGMDGVALARVMQELQDDRVNRSGHDVPVVVFVTAYTDYAVHAFDLEAADYLTKPVRLERLQQALVKVEQRLRVRRAQDLTSSVKDSDRPSAVDTMAAAGEKFLVIQDRGRTERVPLSDVLYFKAELKYLTVRTVRRSYVFDGALSELENAHADQFLRIHRNALIARCAVRALVRHQSTEPGDEGEGWAVQLRGIDELLMVSRRQVGAVRAAIGNGSP